MSRTDPQFNLRIPQFLRDRVTAAAQANKRSATAEILARLEESFHLEDLSKISEMNQEDLEVIEAMKAGDEPEKLYTADDIKQAITQVFQRLETTGREKGKRPTWNGHGPKPAKRYRQE
ncbi:Arc family DNA-binding protein [Azotobacter chroococcum]|uniref:Arc-like DNA binding dprotein n=1 Tax=Azotobacter chroococcum TaxID=353 RepID=A0A4R1PR45_9GAMM|nr:Arc family DNA-binding protein [Azotobacter chroococcum]MEE4463791.1 Arc family DNA-binding protein [Azotobacter chroococcum]TCL26807.1 Arc-like DNA binding dprotein [Azotobacter chroococcum]